MTHVLLSSILVFSSTGHIASDLFTSEQNYKQCLQECVSFYEAPGYALKKCVDTCATLYPVSAPKNPNFCETYEDCDRDRDGGSDI